MPDVLNIRPLDIHIEMRISLSELNMLADFLDMCEFTLDKDDEQQVEMHDFVTKEFFPFINKLTDDLMSGAAHGIRSDSKIS